MLNFDLSHEQQLIYSYGDSLAREFDRKYWMACAEKKAFPAEMYRKIAADGFLGLMVSERYGGSGLGMLEAALFSEGMSNNGIPMLSLIVGATMSMSPIDKFGTEAQKQRFLPDCCQGKIRFCFAITEPNAGTNTMAATTFAREQGGKFFLSGQKVFITDAGDSDYALVVTRTTPLAEARKKTDGFTLFIVDMKAPGISLQYIPVSVQVPEKQWLVFFDNVELSLDDVLGEVGRGFELLFDSLNPERILVAAMAVGLGR
ncbi:MAG TPA: acyl-CoA dehydrogenase family protein, partial [Rhodocyclaceae bacterium]|nr:acyl-CoA dehydrogenase family protein [Rhodocyclaceae bacterium]